ncbi:hypothetical protein COO60DRAFT_1502958 [Scenedesmus sp. NREL 46B-D3]|nr:hypothetical protein COO60DRAFT_1502958 [Scenedesmus sp. NREL 46B-D3]
MCCAVLCCAVLCCAVLCCVCIMRRRAHTPLTSSWSLASRGLGCSHCNAQFSRQLAGLCQSPTHDWFLSEGFVVMLLKASYWWQLFSGSLFNVYT